jgi:hypothetical protein
MSGPFPRGPPSSIRCMLRDYGQGWTRSRNNVRVRGRRCLDVTLNSQWDRREVLRNNSSYLFRLIRDNEEVLMCTFRRSHRPKRDVLSAAAESLIAKRSKSSRHAPHFSRAVIHFHRARWRYTLLHLSLNQTLLRHVLPITSSPSIIPATL